MQSLYEWDFNGRDSSRINEVFDRNIKEFAPGIEDREFPKKLVRGVIENLEKIDNIIEKAAPEWPLQQIAVVDRNILRLGLYELLYGDYEAVPPKVAINEAIELAKSFGGESSGKFINGVLGTVYRELGEPDKDRRARDKKSPPRKEDYVGAVIFRRDDSKIHWVMVRDIFNRWTFVKGHKEADESLEEAVTREVMEEVGLPGKIIGLLGQNTYPATTEYGENVLKEVNYFLFETGEEKITLEEGKGLTDGKWFPMVEVKKLKHYDDTNHIIDVAVKKLTDISD